MQSYFGITDTQATRSGYSRYDSNAGVKDMGLHVKTSYPISQDWIFEAQIGYWRLLNDAADSPIVKDEGSVNQFRGLLGLSFKF